jgi:hypothetical protein
MLAGDPAQICQFGLVPSIGEAREGAHLSGL